VLHKRFVDLPAISRRMVWMFGFASSYALLYALWSGVDLLVASSPLIVAIGFMNSFGAYAEMRANRISLSRTAMFQVLPRLLAMVLGIVVLSEWVHVTPLLILGLLLTFGAAPIVLKPAATEAADQAAVRGSSLSIWIVTLSLVYGIGQFSMRYFSVSHGVLLEQFALAWYGGSLLGALVNSRLFETDTASERITLRSFSEIALLALTVWGSRMFSFAALSLLPLVFAGPIMLVFSYAVPLLVGLLLFGERKALSPSQSVGLAVGILGGILVGFSIARGG
jgi:hypothetical protein